MSTKNIGIVLIVIGLVVILVGLFAGYIGLSHYKALGPNKLMMAGAGLVIGLIGVYLAMLKKK